MSVIEISEKRNESFLCEGYREVSSSNRGELSEIDFEPDIPNWPELNQKALYGLAGEFVELATANSEADKVAVLMTFLAAFGVECGPNPHLMVGDSKHYARIFAVLVGASSKARKGTSAKPVEAIFSLDELFSAKDEFKVSPHKTARWSPGPLSSGEGIAYAVRDETKEWKVNKKTGQGEWTVKDPGIEDKRLFVLDEEFASALSCTRREGNTLSPIIRNIWDKGNIDPLTKTSKMSATGAHIGIVTHITIPELSNMLNGTETINGFANRFLWICVRRSKLVPLPRPMDPIKLYFIREKLMKIIISNKNIDRMKFSDKAEKWWVQVYSNISKERSGMIGSILNRAESQILRLSMLYALLDASVEIKARHLEAALALWNYCKKSAEFIFAERSGSPIANRIILALKDGSKSKSDLHNLFKRHISAKELNGALRELISQCRIKQRKEATGGAPRSVFELVSK